jgi:hypothetical protein
MGQNNIDQNFGEVNVSRHAIEDRDFENKAMTLEAKIMIFGGQG